jgi:hypothetical protein
MQTLIHNRWLVAGLVLAIVIASATALIGAYSGGDAAAGAATSQPPPCG